MTTTTHTHETAIASGKTTRYWIVDVVSAIVRLIRRRHETARLLDLDDRQLSDIGLSRDDVIRALNTSPLHDPTSELARLAGRSH